MDGGMFVFFCFLFFCQKKDESRFSWLSKQSSIDAFLLQHFPLTHNHTNYMCTFKLTRAIASTFRIVKTQRNTQRCSLTRCKTKLLFADFITKSGLIIIMGVWELPYNL